MAKGQNQRGFYLSAEKEAARSLERLLKIAEDWDTTPSGLIQMIADGTLILKPGVIEPMQIRGYDKPRNAGAT